jgi:UDP-2-acetamido-3-amino-2,3-dideoxy-glucuronate N-acetyltransferase
MSSIAVVGAGRWGKNHIKTLSEIGHLGGIIETDSTKKKEFQKLYPDVPFYNTVQETLDSDFNGYVVATPAPTHFEVTRFLIENNKNVLVEKPIALKSEHAKILVDMAEQNNVKLMVGHVLLYHPAIRKIKEMLTDGAIGKLQYMYSNRLNLGTVRTEENILWSFAPHDVSIFQYFVGQMPSSSISEGGTFLQPGVHDSTVTILHYPDNVVAHIFVSWLHPFKEHRLVVIGSKGMISFEDSSAKKELLFYEKGIDWIKGEPIMRDGAIKKIKYDHKMPLTEELLHFVDCIDNSKTPLTDARLGMDVLTILEKAQKSLTKQRVDSSVARKEKNYFIHETAGIGDNVKIGKGTKVWHNSQIQSGAVIGEDCVIGHNCFVGSKAKLGKGVKLESNIDVWDLVTLEDYVFVGPSAVFTNDINPRAGIQNQNIHNTDNGYQHWSKKEHL